MIEIEKAKQEFIKYTSQFDIGDRSIKGKIEHSLRVMQISKEIATKLGLAKEEIDLATLIGLLHDIGRFKQRKDYGTFLDRESLDHGKLGVEILEENDYIRKYIKEHTYDRIIKLAVANHNQYQIEKGLTQKEILFCQLIRDCDKIDILYEGTTIFWEDKETIARIEKGIIQKEVMEQYRRQEIITNGFKETEIDHLVGMISFVFDINLKPSLQMIHDNDYINNIIHRFQYQDKNTKEEIEEVQKTANEYIKLQIKG